MTDYAGRQGVTVKIKENRKMYFGGGPTTQERAREFTNNAKK